MNSSSSSPPRKRAKKGSAQQSQGPTKAEKARARRARKQAKNATKDAKSLGNRLETQRKRDLNHQKKKQVQQQDSNAHANKQDQQSGSSSTSRNTYDVLRKADSAAACDDGIGIGTVDVTRLDVCPADHDPQLFLSPPAVPRPLTASEIEFDHHQDADTIRSHDMRCLLLL